MAFKKTQPYFERKIVNILQAIDGTRENMKKLTIQRQIDAHNSQISSYQQSLVKARADYSHFIRNGG